MSEEIKNPGTEMNEAELANVSGAGRDEDRKAEMRADEICVKCGLGRGKSRGHCGATPYRSLEAYLKEHGLYSVKATPHRTAARQAMPFPPSAHANFLTCNQQACEICKHI